MDSSTISFTRRVAAIPTSVSAFKFSVWGTISTTHLPSFAKLSCINAR